MFCKNYAEPDTALRAWYIFTRDHRGRPLASKRKHLQDLQTSVSVSSEYPDIEKQKKARGRKLGACIVSKRLDTVGIFCRVQIAGLGGGGGRLSYETDRDARRLAKGYKF